MMSLNKPTSGSSKNYRLWQKSISRLRINKTAFLAISNSKKATKCMSISTANSFRTNTSKPRKNYTTFKLRGRISTTK
jgi:hypothetical protein